MRARLPDVLANLASSTAAAASSRAAICDALSTYMGLLRSAFKVLPTSTGRIALDVLGFLVVMASLISPARHSAVSALGR